MSVLTVYPATKPLRGSVEVPADKSITHRAVLLSGLATGTSRIALDVMGEDNASTLHCLEALGVTFLHRGATLEVTGVGLHGLAPPARELDCGNSGTTMRLLAGVLAAQRFSSTLVGDASLSRRPMQRIARPLRLRGARIEGAPHATKLGEITAPLVVGPLPDTHALSALEYESPVASAQVKSAVLLSGLYATGPTLFKEPHVSRDHTERMLQALGVRLETVGAMIRLSPDRWSGRLEAFDMGVVGDLSAAAFFIAAAMIVEGSEIEMHGVGLNPTRSGVLEIARDAGGDLEVQAGGESLGEPKGAIVARGSRLQGLRTGGETVLRAIDEVPIIAALLSRAKGTSRIEDAGELRVKESDRIRSMVTMLNAFGVLATELPEGMQIEGSAGGSLRGATVDAGGDHRIAMTAAILGLVADGPTTITGAETIATSFPSFADMLRRVGARVEEHA